MYADFPGQSLVLSAQSTAEIAKVI